MSFFTPVTQVVEIDDENSVTVQRLTHGQKQAILVDAAKLASGDGLVMGIATQGAMLKAAITAWDGPGFEGKPVTPENIEALPPEVADTIAEQAGELLAGVTDDEKKVSGESVNSQ
jgi:hypothetical protein